MGWRQDSGRTLAALGKAPLSFGSGVLLVLRLRQPVIPGSRVFSVAGCRLFSKSRILAQHTRAARAKFLRIMQVTAPRMPLPQQGSCTLPCSAPLQLLLPLHGSW